MIEKQKSYAEEYIRVRKNYYAAMVLAEEISQQSIKKGYRFLNYEKIIFTCRDVIADKVSMIVPENFKSVDGKKAKIKYSELNYPNYLYTDAEGEIHLTYSLLVNVIDNMDIDRIRKQLMESIMKSYFGKLVAESRFEVGNKTVSYFAFTIPDMNEEWFQLLYFTEIDNHILIGGFGCSEYDQKEWTPAFMEMLETIKAV